MATLTLPTPRGDLAPYTLREPVEWQHPGSNEYNRVALAAAHVVADPLAQADPWLQSALDWEGTLAYRRYLFSLGLGVAEAMDTAQRGMGLDWSASLQLIKHTVAEARDKIGRAHV